MKDAIARFVWTFSTRFLTLAFLLIALGASDHARIVCPGFLPENHLSIPAGGTRDLATGITQAQYNAIIDRVQSIYAPDIAKMGGVLHISRDWDNPTVNAKAQRQFGQWIIYLFGGLARHPTVTPEGFALVACHEIGHHVAGAPKMNDWAADEGNADYFATLKCLRRVWSADDNGAIVAQARADGRLDPVAENRCAQAFLNSDDHALCLRSSLAAESVSALFMLINHDSGPSHFGTPDPTQVAATVDGYPPTQCRMDTFLDGASCQVAWLQPMNDHDANQGACVEGVDATGYRPRCWFSP